MMKKFICLIIAAILCLSCTAFAADETETVDFTAALKEQITGVIEVSDEYPYVISGGTSIVPDSEINSEITAKLTITNNSDKNIKFNNLQFTCGNASVFLAEKDQDELIWPVVNAGETADFSAAVTPLVTPKTIEAVCTDGDTTSEIAVFSFKNGALLDFGGLTFTQAGVSGNKYLFDASGNIKNIGNEVITNFDFSVSAGSDSLHKSTVSTINPKSEAETEFQIAVDSSKFTGGKCIFTLKAENKSNKFTEEAQVFVSADISVSDIKAEITAADETNYIFKVTGKITNNGCIAAENITANVKSGETVFGTLSIDKIDVSSSKAFEITVSAPKTLFSENSLKTEISVICGENTESQELILSYSTVLSGITINGSDKLSVVAGEKTDLTVGFLPVTAEVGEYTLESEDTDTAVIENSTVTGLKEGSTNIIFTAGETVYKIPLTVTRAYGANEIKNITFYYTDKNNNKIILTPYNETAKENGYFYTDTRYTLHFPNGVSEISIEAEGMEGTAIKANSSSNEGSASGTSIDDMLRVNTSRFGSNRPYLNIVSSKDSEKTVVYSFLMNELPTISVPDNKLYAFKDLSTDLNVDDYFNDKENEKSVSSISVIDEDGSELGKVVKSEGSWYWRYKTSYSSKNIAAKFVVTDRFGGVSEADITVECALDTQEPTWTSSKISKTSVSTNSAAISWGLAKDNDEVSYYLVMYSKNSKFSNYSSKEVSADTDSSSRKTTVSGLSSGTKYYFKVRAYDRSGNYVESDSISFNTSSSGGLGGGGNSGNNNNNSGITNNNNNNTNNNTNNNVNSEIFSDLEAYGWAKNQIVQLAKDGIIKGRGDGTFDPSAKIIRGDFMLLLSRALNFKGEFSGNFEDVTEDMYYYEAIGLAKALGITDGMGDNKFDPTRNISRQDMMVMTKRALEVMNKIPEAGEKPVFGDENDISEYAKDAVSLLASVGIIQGDEHGNVMPKNNATRAETAVIIYRIINLK